MNTKRPYIYVRSGIYVCEPILLSSPYKLVQARTNTDSSRFCMLAGHQRVRARSTEARHRRYTRSCLFVCTRTSTRTAGTVLPAPPFAFVFAWRSHTNPLPPCIHPRHPYREISQQPRLLELRPSKAIQASAHVRLAHDPHRIHGGNVHICSTEAFRCAGSRGRTARLEVNFIKRRSYLSHRIYELHGIIAANHDYVARLQAALSSNLVETLLADANLASSKFALLPSTVFTLAAFPPVPGRMENVGLAHRFFER